jgi:hypothetical protein
MGGDASLNTTHFDGQSYLIRTSAIPISEKQQGSRKEILGEKVKILSNSFQNHAQVNCVDLTFGTKTNDPDRPKETCFFNKFSHPIAESEFLAGVAGNFNTLAMSFKKADIEVFTFNREFTFKNMRDTTEVDFEGKYKLEDLQIMIPVNGKKASVPAFAACKFVKIIQDETKDKAGA